MRQLLVTQYNQQRRDATNRLVHKHRAVSSR